VLLEAVGNEYQVPGFIALGQVRQDAIERLMLGAGERLRSRQDVADGLGDRAVQQYRTKDTAFGRDVLQMG